MRAGVGEYCKVQFLQASFLSVIIFTLHFQYKMFFFSRYLLIRPLEPHMTLYLMLFEICYTFSNGL